MTLFGGSFFLFLIAAVIVCYVVPQKYRWIPMLLASFVFYCWGGIRQAAYLLFTSFTVWGGALAMQRIREKEQQLRKEAADWSREQVKKSKAAARKKQRLVFLLVLLVNLGILGVIKYFDFASENLCRLMNALGGGNAEPLRVEFLVPLGISFYTFQSLGYLIDIYNLELSSQVQHRLKENFKGRSPAEAFAWAKVDLVGEGGEEGGIE